ncbi:MAG TPA: ABC transporter ATP-binding protein, partial [Mucilaginibacter sp.]|nr:ABC transporter ATP-binding protein [Mucilaginibacter sp.]
IIDRGELLFQGSIKDLEAISQPQVHIEVKNTVDVANFLKKQGYTVSDISDDHLLVPFTSKMQMAELNALLVNNNYQVFSIHKVHKDLEKLFLDITQKA